MFIIKKSFKFLFFTSLIFIFSYFFNFNNYVGNKFLFFIFQFSAFILFLTAIKKNNSAFEFFTYFFFLLSFWFKFNCILYFRNIKITEGDFDLTISNYDKATFIIIVTFIACIFGSFIKEFLFKKYIKEKKNELNNSFVIFYRRYRIYIFCLFIGLLILIWSTNFYFKIYSKGLINENVEPLVKYFYSWATNYGLAIITSSLIYIDFLIFKKNFVLVFGLFESFFTQINIYSRTFLLSFFAYLRGFLLMINIKKLMLSKYTLAKIIFIMLIIFFLSIYFVTKFRSTLFNEYNKSETPVSLMSSFSEIFSLSINRWVGIDSLLAVSQSNNLNLEFFFSAWKEEKKIKEKSFYIDNFFSRFKYSETEKTNLNRVITPGIVAFLYYSGSASFIFFIILILILICSSIEMLFYKFSLCNIILSNIIGYTLAIRFIHFGYLPINTINFLLSFFFTFILVYLSRLIVIKNKT
jgi:hypothetical protein